MATIASAGSIAVITGADGKGVGVSKDEIANIYLGNSSTYGNDITANPVDHSTGSATRKKFLKAVIGKSEQDFARHWSTRRFSGRGNPPKQLSGDSAVKRWVAENPDAIGYIDGKSMDKTVKLLLIIP
ncbi:MAG: phosphate ABC transporter substrate-binding protein [Proteobacteria bacterium]|nr:phosphate ABC transporter substrate-binding protein [Pseudomonadota bacterium]